MKKNEFSKFLLDDRVIEKLQEKRITKPTAIQEEAIPKVRDGKDVIAQSMTGTGKTISYITPLISNFLQSKSEKQVLIIVPTKELAVQIYQEALYYGEMLDFKPVCLVPGQDVNTQAREIKQNQQLVIAVPGRIMKLAQHGEYRFSRVTTLVLDEADFLIDLGFIKDLQEIFSQCKQLTQLLIFSATLSSKTKEAIDLARNQKNATRVVTKNTLPVNIENVFIPIQSNEYRDKTLLKLLTIINPYVSIIFTRTRDESEVVYKLIKEAGYVASLLNGNLQASKRKRIINDFRQAKFQYLIATDLAGRGLDFEGITHIINYTQPHNEIDYIHRAGRTGRMNEKGMVISICNELDEGYLKKYAHVIEISLKAVKLTKNGFEELKKYKGVKPRFNLQELKQMEHISKNEKKQKMENKHAHNKRRNPRK